MNNWTTKVTSYWGAPSGATYKVVKRTDSLWECFKYNSGGKWHQVAEADSKTAGQQECEEHENSVTGL